MDSSLIKKAVGELVGSLMLAFCGLGVLAHTRDEILPAALSMGFIFMSLYYTVAKSSNCHLNPAVSLAFLLSGKIGVIDFIFFLIFQIVGACLGSLALFGFYEMVYNLDKTNFVFDGTNTVLDYFQKGFTPRGVFSTFLVEVILTAILVFVILSIENDTSSSFREYNGIIIGCAYVFVTFACFGIDFSCLNPAKALAACLSQVTYFETTTGFELCFIWIVGPLVGAILGFILEKIIGGNDGSNSGSTPNRRAENESAKGMI